MKTKALAIGALALSLAGCDEPETGTAGEVLEVECIGMARYAPLAGFFRLSSPANQRCVALMSDTSWGGEMSIYDSATFGQQNGLTLQVTYGDEVWTSRSGTVDVDILEDRGMGEFDVTATNEAGESLRITGPIDFCEYVDSEDCPYGFDPSNLPMNVRFDYGQEDWSSQDDTYATDCRAVIDTATQGLQVDMQMGVWRGRNISLYQVDCDRFYPSVNSFQFRAGAVTGPGTYGPWAVTNNFGNTEELPSAVMKIPLRYYGFSCEPYYDRVVTTSISESRGSVCEFTVEQGEPYGLFSMSCDNASLFYDSTLGELPEFNLETPCTVVVQ